MTFALFALDCCSCISRALSENLRIPAWAARNIAEPQLVGGGFFRYPPVGVYITHHLCRNIIWPFNSVEVIKIFLYTSMTFIKLLIPTESLWYTPSQFLLNFKSH
jgi:hypothetical protein